MYIFVRSCSVVIFLKYDSRVTQFPISVTEHFLFCLMLSSFCPCLVSDDNPGSRNSKAAVSQVCSKNSSFSTPPAPPLCMYSLSYTMPLLCSEGVVKCNTTSARCEAGSQWGWITVGPVQLIVRCNVGFLKVELKLKALFFFTLISERASSF